MLSTETLFLLYLSTGFTIGFGHCIGMCGPIVVSFSLNLKEKSIFIPQLLYHLGRITTYAILGAVVAAAGSLTMITANIDATIDEKQEILEAIQLKTRMKRVLELLSRQLEVLKVREGEGASIRLGFGRRDDAVAAVAIAVAAILLFGVVRAL